MANITSNRFAAPKQWTLTEHETLISFESWKNNLTFTLQLDERFATFLNDNTKWLKATRKKADKRGFEDDAEGSTPRVLAAAKCSNLELMLGQISNFCPIISRRQIINDTTSIGSVWQTIKLHFGFQNSGSNFIDFASIKFEPPERHETLYQRMLSFVENNLLTTDGGITHKGAKLGEDEDLTPTLENLIILLWLKEVHPNLPNTVKQKYGAYLRSQSLASLKPEISASLPSLIEEAKMHDNARIGRSGPFQQRSRPTTSRQFPPSQSSRQFPPSQSSSNRNPGSFRRDQRRSPISKSCPLCKAHGRPETSHFLSACRFLPESDRKFMTKARQVFVDDDDNDDDDDFQTNDNPGDTEAPSNYYDEDTPVNPRIGRVNINASPRFKTFYGHNPATVTIDTGAEANLIRESAARFMNCPVYPSTQVAYQADGLTPLRVKGETHIDLTRNDLTLRFSGLIVDTLDVDILAGVPFMVENDIAVRPSKKLISIGDKHQFSYSAPSPQYSSTHHSTILRATSRATILPGEYLEVAIDNVSDSDVAIEPHVSSPTSKWPTPGFYSAINGRIRIPNTTGEPQLVAKHAHIGQVSSIYYPDTDSPPVTAPISENPPHPVKQGLRYSEPISVNPDDLLPANISTKFNNLHHKFDSVFNPDYSTYNQSLGAFEAVVNMGPVKPPQRKGRLPQYSRNKLTELQSEIDKLERLGVLAKPETVNVTIEYLNPSLLVKKPNGNFRLVTAFTEVGKYCKPQPSLMPSVDSTLRNIARWKFVIKTDLTSAFYQIPLSHESMKYCGIVSPFKGIRCYTRCAMGMPGSETALEELMCRIVGDLIEKGTVTKIADDLYTGGDTPEELLANWECILERLNEANIKLSASKTVIAPKTTTILGWIWEGGYISPDPHKISSLTACTPPPTTKGLRSFIGAYKVLARVLPRCASLLQPLDRATHGKKSSEKIEWSEPLRDAFLAAQRHLRNTKSIVLPKEDDLLWIVTDGASSNSGMGATLYAVRKEKLHLAGFFSQQLNSTHMKWFSCEIEGITIAAAVKYFDGFIIQSKHRTNVLTDSKPCVEAYQKLLRGQFSSNVRLSTFLSAVSRHHVTIQHLAGAANLSSDFQSRQPMICHQPKCQVCAFANALDESVVRNVSVTDVLDGRMPLPFTSRKAWLSTQSECHDLRRARAQLLQGTRPSKKETTIRSVKRYLNKVDLATDGVIVVKSNDNLASQRELIVVPEEVLPGLLTALHLQLNHPSQNELSKVVRRYFWAINLEATLSQTSTVCHTCASLKKLPHSLIPQTTSNLPDSIGTQFAADVLCRERQKILVVREYISGLTRACLINSEKHEDLRTAIILLTTDMIPLDGPLAVIRTDPAPGFKALQNDPVLKKHRLQLDLGRIKAPNKNPVAERAVQELENEILRTEPGSVVTPLSLNNVVCQLNARIRTDGLSAREVYTQRDQFSNDQIPVNDRDIITDKHLRSITNNKHSEQSKAKGAVSLPNAQVKVGDLVYIYTDRNKHSARNRYLVTSIDDEWCHIRKFIGNTLRANTYKVKPCEIYKVPASHVEETLRERHNDNEEYEDEQCRAQMANDKGPTVVDHGPEIPNAPVEITEPLQSSPYPVDTVETQAEPTPAAILPPVDPNENEMISAAHSTPPVRAAENNTNPRSGRPVRNRHMPSRFQDYVLE